MVCGFSLFLSNLSNVAIDTCLLVAISLVLYKEKYFL